jgi:hypothetical protein
LSLEECAGAADIKRTEIEYANNFMGHSSLFWQLAQKSVIQ